jgi:RNA polymerase sigma factor (sigma-70 family)
MPTELEMIARAQRGDGRALRELVTKHLPFVRWHARRVGSLGRPLEHDELVAEGVIGLVRAIQMFDPGKGTELAPIATWHIRQRMVRAARRAWGLVHVPVHANAPEADVSRLPGIPLDAPGAEPADLEPTPEDAYAAAELRDRLRRLVDDLDERSAHVMIRRLDFATLDVIGAELGLTRERVRQIERDAVGQMRRWVARDRRNECAALH